MRQWGLVVGSRGSESQNSHSDTHNDVEEPLYSSLAEVDANSASLASYAPPRTQEKESSRASLQSLIPLQRGHSRNTFTAGAVFAIIDDGNSSGGKYKCN